MTDLETIKAMLERAKIEFEVKDWYMDTITLRVDKGLHCIDIDFCLDGSLEDITPGKSC